MAETTQPATMRDHWQKAQGYLVTMLDPGAYEVWVRTLEPQGYANGVLVLAASTTQQRDRVAARLDRVIRHALWMQTGKDVTVEYVLRDGGVSC